MAAEVLLIPHNHFDPIWRRCFDRTAFRHGVAVRSCAEVEAHCIDRWLDLADHGYPFSDGQTAVWRTYLAQRPDRRADLRRHADAGALCIVLAGETVQDSNLPAAEGLIRNFSVAWPDYRSLCGHDHPGLKLAWVEDAFGNSANYPQILRGVGAEVVCHTSYRPCPEPVWVGIDGTKIACYDHVPKRSVGVFEKHPPCPTCRGIGCDACGGKGLVLLEGFPLEKLRDLCRQAAADSGTVSDNAVGGAFAIGGAGKAITDSPATAVFVVTEEFPPDARLLELVRELNAEFAGNAAIRLANPTDVYAAARPSLERSCEQRDATPTPELNPAMSGTYVSRIALKQRTRAIAYKLLLAESQRATAAWHEGRATNMPAGLIEAWRLVCFDQFHDAITGTHIDSANVELHDMLDRAEGIAGQHLSMPAPRPVVDDFAPVQHAGSVRLGALDVTFDRFGIGSILVDGTDLFGHVPASPKSASRTSSPTRSDRR
jgi:hypothetical protein